MQKAKKEELIRTVKFVLFSISAGVIEFVSFTLLTTLTDWPYWPCYLIALVLSVIWNFTLNREFTFRSANNVPIAMLKVAAYYAVFTPLSTLLGNWLTETLGWNEFLVTILNMVLNFITEYLFDRFVVFRDSIDTNKRAQEKAEQEQEQEPSEADPQEKQDGQN
ncbi:MAG: GtrA family protein [Lachnospiraceae bacterium]|nr:GtrA family protein [Lachnospiraceae bacterium]